MVVEQPFQQAVWGHRRKSGQHRRANANPIIDFYSGGGTVLIGSFKFTISTKYTEDSSTL